MQQWPTHGLQEASAWSEKNYDNLRLECEEIFEARGKNIESQTLDLLEELKNIDEEIEKSLFKIRWGRKKDLRELDPSYWSLDTVEKD